MSDHQSYSPDNLGERFIIDLTVHDATGLHMLADQMETTPEICICEIIRDAISEEQMRRMREELKGEGE